MGPDTVGVRAGWAYGYNRAFDIIRSPRRPRGTRRRRFSPAPRCGCPFPPSGHPPSPAKFSARAKVTEAPAARSELFRAPVEQRGRGKSGTGRAFQTPVSRRWRQSSLFVWPKVRSRPSSTWSGARTVLEAVAGKAAFKPLHEVMKEAMKPSSRRRFRPIFAREPRTKVVSFAGGLLDPGSLLQPQCLQEGGLDPERPPKTGWRFSRPPTSFRTREKVPPHDILADVDSHRQRQRLVRCSAASGRGTVFNGCPRSRGHARHLAQIQFFKNFGRRNEADKHFLKGECARRSPPIPGPIRFSAKLRVELGVAPLRITTTSGGTPAHLADGASPG